LAAGVLALVAMTGCAPGGPAIQEISPAKGEQNVAADAPIRVVFNHDMDHASVESRLSIAPLIDGCDDVACPRTWSGRALTIKHQAHQFASDAHYRVTLRAGYRDAAGQVETTDHFWDFRTEAAPSVGAVTPAEGTSGAAVDADITIQLSRNALVPPPMEVTLTGTGDPESVPYRVGVSPDDPRRLVLSPLSLLRPLTAYRLHLGPGLSDTHHNSLGTARDFHFTTGALDLTRSLAFLVRDQGAPTASRVALLRPPAGINAPAPSLRVVYRSTRPIRAFGWSSDSTMMYVQGTDGRVVLVPLDGRAAIDTDVVATAMSPSPTRPEAAFVVDGELHIGRPQAPSPDNPPALALPQAGRVSGTPAWSGDGRRLAVAVDDGHGVARLRILDRETLSVAEVPGSTVSAGGSTLAWSVDGTALAFSRPGGEVWVYRPLAAQGSGPVRVGTLLAAAMAWSSDGGSLFAAGSPSTDRPSLVYRAPGQPVDGQGLGFTALPTSHAGDSQPVVPSFDRRLAFVRAAAGVPQLWLMNNDGTGTTQLTFARYLADEGLVTDGVDQPHWSPGNGP